MIVHVQVELNIHGASGPSAHVTELLGTTPDEQYEIGDPKGDGPRVFDVSIWNLFSNRHVDEVRASFGQDPWGRLLWVLDRLPEDAAAPLSRLRDEGYTTILSVDLITDHPENAFTVPTEVLRRVAAVGLDLEVTAVSTEHLDITHGDVW